MGRIDLTEGSRRFARAFHTFHAVRDLLRAALLLPAAAVGGVVVVATVDPSYRLLALMPVGALAMFGALHLLGGLLELRRRAEVREPHPAAGPLDYLVPEVADHLRATRAGGPVTSGPPVVVLRSTSLRGPRIVISLSLAAIGGAVVCTVLAGVGFVLAVDDAVVTVDGRPGPGVLVSAPAPGTASVDLRGGERYAVHLVVPTGAVVDDELPTLPTPVRLVAPSGVVVLADGSPGVTTYGEVTGWASETVGAFTAPESGRYVVTAPVAGDPRAWVALAADRSAAETVGATGASAVAVLIAWVLWPGGIVGLFAGVVWALVRLLVRWGARGAGAGAAVVDAPTVDAPVRARRVTYLPADARASDAPVADAPVPALPVVYPPLAHASGAFPPVVDAPVTDAPGTWAP